MNYTLSSLCDLQLDLAGVLNKRFLPIDFASAPFEPINPLDLPSGIMSLFPWIFLIFSIKVEIRNWNHLFSPVGAHPLGIAILSEYHWRKSSELRHNHRGTQPTFSTQHRHFGNRKLWHLIFQWRAKVQMGWHSVAAKRMGDEYI